MFLPGKKLWFIAPLHLPIPRMHSLLALTIAGLAFSVEAAASETGSRSIQWAPCGFNSTSASNETSPVLCGTLAVPLDYTQPNCNNTIDLHILKVPAISSPSKGSIFTDAGGPGINNTEHIVTLGTTIRKITGGEYDIVTWNPRGTRDTLLFSCWPNNTVRAEALRLYPSLGGYITGNSSDAALGQIWAEATILDGACNQTQNATGNLIGTAFTARDVMQIVDATEEDRMLRYWGFSYGTLLGATAAAMFPDRIDKLALDGVVNPMEYYHSTGALGSFDSADAAFTGFVQGCVASPSLCSLAGNYTAAELETLLYDFMDHLKFNPIVLESSAVLMTYGSLRSLILAYLKAPQYWSLMERVFSGLLTGNHTLVDAVAASLLSSSNSEADDEGLQGIKYGDTFTRWPTLEDTLPDIEVLHNSSRLLGDVNDNLAAQCAQWPFEAKERYSGDFQVSLPNPALIIGNTYDPATSIIAARNVSAGFNGSVLLEQNGYGHASVAQASLCTARNVRAYFSNGSLPQPGTICEIDELLFAKDTTAGWVYVLEQLSQG